MATKLYKNETDILETVYDYLMRPHRVLPGESVELDMGEAPEGVVGIKSNPPVGMQGIKNVYRNPETERMEIDFIDAPREE